MSSIVDNPVICDELVAKYNQVNILFGDKNRTYKIAIKPAFERIADCLYDSLVPDIEAFTHTIENKMLSICREYPIFTHSRKPTLQEVLHAIKYVREYEQVYLFVYSFNYKIGDFFASKITYCVQTGMWMTMSDCEFNESPFAYHVAVNHDVFNDVINIDYVDVAQKYEHVIPIKFIDGTDQEYTVKRLRKVSLSVIHNFSYTWRDPIGDVFGYCDTTTYDIVNPTHTEKIATFLMKVPSLHTFGYHGLFKPSLDEALAAIPSEVFNCGSKLLITTCSLPVDINEMVVGEWHIAETIVWRLEDNVSCV